MPPAEAWPLLTDVARIAPCMPGAKLAEAVDADTWRGELAVRLGPVGMLFLGELSFVARDPLAGTASARASAQEARNRGSADARIDFRLSPAGEGTRVHIVTDLVLAGQAAGVHRSPRAPVRLLHAGHAHHPDRVSVRPPGPERGRGAPRHLRQPVPLHRIYGNRACRARVRENPAGAGRMTVRGAHREIAAGEHRRTNGAVPAARAPREQDA